MGPDGPMPELGFDHLCPNGANAAHQSNGSSISSDVKPPSAFTVRPTTA
jgi:hypothetical protein